VLPRDVLEALVITRRSRHGFKVWGGWHRHKRVAEKGEAQPGLSRGEDYPETEPNGTRNFK
jgi:hypothetical protein